MFLEIEDGGQDRYEEAVKKLFNQIHSCFTTKLVYGLRD